MVLKLSSYGSMTLIKTLTASSSSTLSFVMEVQMLY